MIRSKECIIFQAAGWEKLHKNVLTKHKCISPYKRMSITIIIVVLFHFNIKDDKLYVQYLSVCV